MKRLVLVVAVIGILAVQSLAQGFCYQNIALTSTSPLPNGITRIVSNPNVRVCTEPATGMTCFPLATIYLDAALTQPLTNPFAGDINGNYQFCAASGNYHIQVTGTEAAQVDISYVPVGLPGGPFFVLAGNNTATGTNTFSGANTFSGTFNALAGGQIAGTFTGNQTYSGNQIFNGTDRFNGNITSVGVNTMANLNTVVYVDGVLYTSIPAALAALSNNPGALIVPIGTYATAAQVASSSGQSVTGIPCVSSEASTSICGSAVTWTGVTNTAMFLSNNVSGTGLANISMDCLGVSGCLGAQYSSTSGSGASFYQAKNLQINNAHIGMVFGDPSQTPSASNIQADIANVLHLGIKGTGLDSTAECIHVNGKNSIDQTTIDGVNCQGFSIGYHQVEGPIQTLEIRNFNVGCDTATPSGAKTAFQIDSSSVISPNLVGAEVEGGCTHAFLSNATNGVSTPYSVYHLGSQFNTPGDFQMNGKEWLASIAGSGGTTNSRTIGSGSGVVSIAENCALYSKANNNIICLGFSAGAAEAFSPYVTGAITVAAGPHSFGGNSGFYADGAPGVGNGTQQQSFDANPTFSSSATSQGSSYLSLPGTAAAGFTMARMYHYDLADVTIGSGSTVTAQAGFHCPAMTHGGTNLCFYSEGSTPSSLGGNLTVGGAIVSSSTIKATAFIDAASNPAASGVLRLANTSQIDGRNAANSGDVLIASINASNQDVLGGTAGTLVSGPMTSNLATGTAPLVVASTTPVTTLTVANHAIVETCGTTSTCSPTQQQNFKMVTGKVTLSGGTVTVTALPFLNNGYICNGTDETATNAVQAGTKTATTIVFNGTGTDVVAYICVGP